MPLVISMEPGKPPDQYCQAIVTPGIDVERMTKDQRIRLCRPPRPLRSITNPLSHPSSPRRFLPPTPTTRPMEIFEEASDRSINGFKRFVHHQDEFSALFFVDGACLDQGDPIRRRAGCGVVWNATHKGLAYPLEGTVGGPEQTSNRAELRAVVLWIQMRLWEAGGYDRLVIATDSEYVVEGICGRVDNWKRRGWRTAAGTPAAHRDLWEILLAELEKADEAGISVLFWRIPREFNGRADIMAKAGAELAQERLGTLSIVSGLML